MQRSIVLGSAALTGSHVTRCPPTTPPNFELLAEHVLRNTPEFNHFGPGTSFSWVLLREDDVTAPEDLQRAVVHQLRARYRVFTSFEDVPDAYLAHTTFGDQQVTYPDDGFYFYYQVLEQPDGLVEITYHDYESPVAASGHSTVYRWCSGRWQVVEEKGGWVA